MRTADSFYLAGLASLLHLTLMLGCGKTVESSRSDGEGLSEVASFGLQGLIHDPAGAPLGGVEVVAGALQTTTDAGGHFALGGLSGAEAIMVAASLEGYSSLSRAISMPDGDWAYTELTLAPVERRHLWAASSGGILETESGLRLEIPAGAVVHEDGTPVTGVVLVDLALLDEVSELAALPLPYTVEREDGIEQPIFSSAALYLALWSGEEALGLAAPVTLSLPTGLGTGEEGLQVFAWSSEAERWHEAGEAQEEGERIVVDLGRSSLRGRIATEAVVEMDRWFGVGVPGDLPKDLCSRLRDEAGGDLKGVIVEALWCREEGSPCHYGLWETDGKGRIYIDAPMTGMMTLRLLYGEARWGPEEVDLAKVTEDECHGLGVWTATDADLDDDGWPGEHAGGGDCVDDADDEGAGGLAPADIHPQAKENWYDGVDQDCAGDDDLDQDGDGDRCDPDHQPKVCPGLSVAERGGDCDDKDGARASTFAERCEDADMDEDCDGSADDADTGGALGQRTWFLDADGDCWGGSASVSSCDAIGDASARCGRAAREAGESCVWGAYVLCQGDCADVASRDYSKPEKTWPGAPEDCDADEDYNCDKSTDHTEGEDVDDDGQPACGGSATDCDDTSESIDVDLSEICDNDIDDDCDGLLDETEEFSFLDADGDGHGDPDRILLYCREISWPKASIGDDCDDGDGYTFPGAAEAEGDACTTDRDADGYGADTWSGAGAQPETWTAGEDCDDTETDVSPVAEERCASEGVDDDCDGTVDEDDADDAELWFVDVDGDGWLDRDGDTLAACTRPADEYLRCEDTPTCVGSLDDAEDDCDDLVASTYPGADELCNPGGYDDDCDGLTDEDDAVDIQIWYADSDGDGFINEADTRAQCFAPDGYLDTGEGDCDDTDSYWHTWMPWYTDGDGDGFGDAGSEVVACAPEPDQVTLPGDCDDANPETFPGAEEACDGLDSDCDGLDMTLQVDADWGPYTTVQEGIDAAEDGEIVCVHEGIYVENIDLSGKAITVSGYGAELQGTGLGSVVTIERGETRETVLEGFTISGGGANYGGGIYVVGSSPTLRELVVTNNEVIIEGGGVYLESSSAFLTGVTISSNSALESNGGGLYVSGSVDDVVALESCTIQGNVTYGFGGGIALLGGVVESQALLVGNNYATMGGGGIYVGGGASLKIDGDSQITFNDTSSGGGGVALDATSRLSLMRSEVSDNTSVLVGAGLQVEGTLEMDDVQVLENGSSGGEGPEYGGGIWAGEGAIVTARELYLSGNGATYQGGGLWASLAVLQLTDVVIVKNLTRDESAGEDDAGGGLYQQGGTLEFQGGIVEGNSSLQGGGVSLFLVSGSLTDVRVADNAAYMGGGLLLYCDERSVGVFPDLGTVTVQGNVATAGAGVMIMYCSSLDLSLVDVSENVATAEGGGYFLWEVESAMGLHASENSAGDCGGGATVWTTDVGTTLWDIELVDNTSADGGGVCRRYGWDETISLSLVRGVIYSNEAEDCGGGVYNDSYETPFTLENIRLLANSAERGGGYCEATTRLASGLTIQNSVVAHNVAEDGAALYFSMGDHVLLNTVFWANEDDGDSNAGISLGFWAEYTSFTLDYLLLYGNTFDLVADLPGYTGAENVLTSDPLFVDTSSSDPLEWDLHPATGSPLIDAGDRDILDPDGTRSDIGAYGGPDAESE